VELQFVRGAQLRERTARPGEPTRHLASFVQ
jgi:hypothetical protein